MKAPVAPPLIVPNTTRRDAFIAALAGIIIFGLLGYGIVKMAQPVQGNKLTGVIVAKQFTPQREQQISFSGRRIEGVKEIDGEYLLKVRVEAQNKVYEVPVEKNVYLAKKEGDPLTFIRPRSEQR